MHAFGSIRTWKLHNGFGHGTHDIKVMKSLSKSNYRMYANLPGAIELRESSFRWIGKQLGAAIWGEGVAAASERKRFLLACRPWANSSLGSAGHS